MLSFLRRVYAAAFQRTYPFFPLQFRKDSTFGLRDWQASARRRVSIGRGGSPLPWITYPAIAFLESRDLSSLSVFEYGSGNSTCWWAARTARVRAVENDAVWFDLVRQRLPSTASVELVGVEDRDRYVTTPLRLDPPFDIIAIDGRFRVRCADLAPQALSPGGVLILDNAEREYYRPGVERLRERGFRRIEFWGMGPINDYEWCTTVFYRDGNCLGI